MRNFIFILILVLAQQSYGAVSQLSITGNKFKSLRNIDGGYTSTTIMEIGDSSLWTQDNSFSSFNDSGSIWTGFGLSVFSINFTIENDSTIKIYSIGMCCESTIWDQIMNFKTNGINQGFEMYIEFYGHLRNGNEIHFDFDDYTNVVLNKTNLIKDGYLSDVMYLYETELYYEK